MEWELAARGALYCVCPVTQHMTLVLSNRVDDQVRTCKGFFSAQSTYICWGHMAQDLVNNQASMRSCWWVPS